MLTITLSFAFAWACGDAHHLNGPTELTQGLATCGSAAPFSVVPLDPASIAGWVPLGATNPPAHTFPTDHQYIYLRATGGVVAPIPLRAPGAVTLVQAKVTKYSAGNEDYALSFAPCADLLAEFGHVRTLSPALAAAIGAMDQRCNTYAPDGANSVTQCYSKVLAVPLQAGDVIGTAAGLDLSLFDRRRAASTVANASRWTGTSTFDRLHVVPFSDYYVESTAAQIRPLLGAFDGRTQRTIAPLGGTIATDIPGTMQGIWIREGQPTFPEAPHLAIVPDHVDPTQFDVSVGTSHAGLAAGSYIFRPIASGQVDRDPGSITPGSTVYCVDLRFYFGPGQQGSMAFQLDSPTALRAQWRGVTCANGGLAPLTAAAVSYVR